MSDCSGRGYFAPDTQRCECHDCYRGASCANRSTTCVLTLLSVGQPYLLQQFWQALPAGTASVRIEPGYRGDYQYPSVFPPKDFPLPPPLNVGYDVWKAMPGIGPSLDAAIRGMHAAVGNVETEGRYIIVGTGATSLFQAATFAYSKLHKKAVPVVARSPRYDMYNQYYVVTQNPTVARWAEDTRALKDGPDVVELVTHPNNPDGHPRLGEPPLFANSSKIHDLVYYWPHLCGGACEEAHDEGALGSVRMAKADVDLAVFSLTKFTGHAGSRFGWALVKDLAVVEQMTLYLTATEIMPSIDTAYRTLELLRGMLADEGGTKHALAARFFASTRVAMKARWARLGELFAGQTRYALRSAPLSAYAWVECRHATGAECAAPFFERGLLGMPGAAFGEDNEAFFRINLTLFDSDFELLVEKLAEVLRA
jgi:histidinol-phosphate/aromatic aminotransferase/cobyric acid decarboxylase-like protein